MSSVNVSVPHSLGASEARNRVRGFEDYIGKYGMKAEWSGNKAELKGFGASGNINVSDRAVDVALKLGLAARAAGVDGDRLRGSIQRRLEEALK